MNLYLLTRTDNIGYDEYDAMVVAAKSRKDALTMFPDGREGEPDSYKVWATSDKISIEYLGKVPGLERRVILSSFNAG